MGKSIDVEIDRIQAEIQKQEAEIQRLREKQKGLQSGDRFVVAEYLHEKECHWNHTDACGFHYDSWQHPLSPIRQEWLDRADALLAIVKQHGLSLALVMEIRHI